MQKVVSSGWKKRKYRLDSFTLVELLTVIAIISILAALTLAAGNAVMTKASRSRAASEIKAMGMALESYKADNGSYPAISNVTGGTTANYSLNPSVLGGTYQLASESLYLALTGKTNYYDTPVAGTKNYLPTLTTKQLGGYKSGTGPTYIADPWSYAYGYSTGDGTTNNVPMNGSGFYDLWSTGGTTATSTTNPTPTNSWIANWN